MMQSTETGVSQDGNRANIEHSSCSCTQPTPKGGEGKGGSGGRGREGREGWGEEEEEEEKETKV